jgi:Fascin domain
MLRHVSPQGEYPRLSEGDSFLLIRFQTRAGAFVFANKDGYIAADTVLTATINDNSSNAEECDYQLKQHRQQSHANSSSNSSSRDEQWILLQEASGMVCFESAHGKYLCAEPDGKVIADRRWDDSWEHFTVETCTAPTADNNDNGESSSSAEQYSDDASTKEWFALRTHHGQYLCLDTGQYKQLMV